MLLAGSSFARVWEAASHRGHPMAPLGQACELARTSCLFRDAIHSLTLGCENMKYRGPGHVRGCIVKALGFIDRNVQFSSARVGRAADPWVAERCPYCYLK